MDDAGSVVVTGTVVTIVELSVIVVAVVTDPVVGASVKAVVATVVTGTVVGAAVEAVVAKVVVGADVGFVS